MDKEQLIKVIDFWQKAALENKLFSRDILDAIDLKGGEIVDIIGPRRSGKSSVLRLLISRLKTDNWLHINFEDPFFIENNNAQTIEDLLDIYKEYYNHNLKYLFFDEIQNIENWEKAVRKLCDGAHYKIIITGSSSKLLSRELSSLITGRHLSCEVRPLSFKEFLTFHKFEIGSEKNIILQKIKIRKFFDLYLKLGGFPKIVLEKNEELLKQYYSDILEKDIIKRYDIRKKDTLEKMGVFLLSNSAKTLSLASLEKTFGVSFEVASTYLDYFKEAFLLFEVPQFSYSIKTQQKAFKKIYSVDTGLANAVSFRFSEDRGRCFENCVFLHLNQMPVELFYYKTRNNLEVDFLIKQEGKSLELMQVCSKFEDSKTEQREVNALLEAMDELELRTGTILTENTEKILKTKQGTIHVIPFYKRFLNE